VAKPELRNLDLARNPAQNNMLFAPVKLKRITRLEVQGNKSLRQSRTVGFQNFDKPVNRGI